MERGALDAERHKSEVDMSEFPTRETVSSGIEGLDEILRGGLPASNL